MTLTSFLSVVYYYCFSNNYLQILLFRIFCKNKVIFCCSIIYHSFMNYETETEIEIWVYKFRSVSQRLKPPKKGFAVLAKLKKCHGYLSLNAKLKLVESLVFPWFDYWAGLFMVLSSELTRRAVRHYLQVTYLLVVSTISQSCLQCQRNTYSKWGTEAVIYFT